MKRMYRSLLSAVFIISEALVPAALALGQSADQEEGGPGAGVARLSLLNGDVTVRRGDSGDWITAAVNGPLLAEDRVLSGVGARAEVQLDYYDRIRLGSDTEIRFPELEWRKYQVQVARGTVIFSALPGTNDQIEFATPAASLRPLSAGSYRVTVLDDGSVEFTVRRGEAEIYTPSGTRKLTPGRTMRVQLSPDNIPEFQLSYETPRDSFDEFSDRRDHDLQRVKSYQYVSRDVYGAEDLDNTGDWVYQAPYGWSWRPYVAPGWAPYREGRWVWVDDSYGWSWVSYDPWGWAPYHYGRWFCSGDSWFWYPGAFGGPHYWRPGLVAFFGYGGFGVGVGFGGLGWVPLAPFETYHPWYGHRGRGGFGGNHYNVVNNYNIVNNYRNARGGMGVSGVNARDFGRGSARPERVGARDLARTSVMRGALPVNPTRDSLRMNDRPVRGALADRASQSGNQRFIASRSVASSNRTPFASRQGFGTSSVEIAANRGSANRSGTAQNGAGHESRQSTAGGTVRSSQEGWTRMSNETRAGTRSSGRRGSANAGGASSQSTSNPARGGWSSFGTPADGRTASGDSAPSTRGSAQHATTSQRGGWTAFGSPERGASGAAQSSRGAWSTGGSTNSGSNYGGRSYSQGGASSRGTASRSDGWSSGGSQSSRGAWSTGGDTNGGRSYGRSESPSRGTASRSDGWSSGGSQSSRGAWSTGGDTNGGRSYGRSESPSRGSSSYSGGWNSGGGSSPRYSAPSRSSAPSHSSGGGSRQSSAPSRSGGGGGGGGGGSHSGGGGPRR
jgi:hypothetical protein